MYGNDVVDSPRWRFADRVPSVDAEVCLNRRHRAAACTRCAAACPVQALTLAEGAPLLNAAQCVSCGVCEAACPTDVFAQSLKLEEKLVQTIVQAPPAVALVCPVKTSPALASAPVDAVVRHRRCLASLSVADLVEMAQPDTLVIWIDDSPCAACPLAAAQHTLHARVTSAHTLLQAVDASARLELCSDYPEFAKMKQVQRPVHDGMQPKISRRQLFGFAAGTTHSTRRADGVPFSHQRLLAQLRRISSEGETQLGATLVPFANVQIDEQTCSACGLCAHFCPTAALQFDRAVQEFAIYFQAGRCIGCNLCQIACPDDAIQIGDAISLGRVIAVDEQVLNTGELAPCTRCGVDTAVCDGAPLCHSCRHGAGIVTALRDDAGLLADLLGRMTLLPPTISI